VKRWKLFLLPLAVAFALASGCKSSSSDTGGGAPPPTTNVLNGQYAFVLSGFDSTGNPMGVAGSITADGHGNITGGSVDVNDNLVISSSSGALSGSYTFDSNSRGTITLTNTVGSVIHPLAFAFTLKTDGTAGSMIGIDANGFVISGAIQKQDATAFSFSKLAGDFAFEFTANAAGRLAVIGRFTLGQNGMSTNGIADFSQAGTGPTFTNTSLSFTLAAAGPNASGRGTMSSTDPGGTANFVYYVVSAGKILVMATDSATLTGVVSRQSTPFSPLSTGTSVFALSGFDTVSPNDISAVGVLTVTGPNSASLLWDADDVGSISTQIALSGQAVTFDSNTGRGTIAVTGGHTNGLFDNGVFYLTSSGNGFLLDATAGTNNRALAGLLQVQTGGGSFGQATFSGKKIIHLTSFSPNEAGAVEGFESDSVTNNVVTQTGAADAKFPGKNPILNQSGSGTENIAIDPTSGRVTVTFNDQNGANTNVLYMIGQDQFVGIDETPIPHNTIPIVFADPQ
jgi:hypothetical protein